MFEIVIKTVSAVSDLANNCHLGYIFFIGTFTQSVKSTIDLLKMSTLENLYAKYFIMKLVL